MAQFKSHKRTETIKARRVTDKDGENIVTSLGVQHVPHGDFVAITDNGLTAYTADEFKDAGWKTSATKKTAAKKTAAKKTAKKSAAKKTAPSAAEQVRARAASSRR